MEGQAKGIVLNTTHLGKVMVGNVSESKMWPTIVKLEESKTLIQDSVNN